MKEIVNTGVEVLRSGKTLLYPTDTVWGIGCDATSEEAVAKVFEIKQRSESKSLVILVDS
ncbi:MAG: Sua5/YciO/YrdC/YwlC family protein, partial [Lutibacter sp.]